VTFCVVHAEFIANWWTGSVQNGGEGKNVDAFNNSLLKGTKYFGNRLCPFANRAYWALADKGLLEDGTIEYVHVNLGATKPAWYKVRRTDV
jgi:glutathione S-transferase